MMRYFAALLFVQLKSVLRSAAIYVSTAFFLAVMLLLAAVLPGEQRRKFAGRRDSVRRYSVDSGKRLA